MGTVRGFIFDYSKCVGCHACVVACTVENSTVPPLNWRKVNHFNRQKLPLLGFVHQSIACNHCQEAPCLKACPSGAYSFDPDTKAVIHNPDLCLGCKYCTWACPFDAPKYNPLLGIVEKCHLCYHRLKENQIPACAQNCPTGALSFGEIEEVSNPQAFGLSQRNIYPRIKVLGDKVKDSVPLVDVEATISSPVSNLSVLKQEHANSMEWLKEWPLAVFTFLSAFLVGWFWSGIGDQSIYLSPWLLLAIAGVAMATSTFHLGKPFRAFKSIINLKTSWLSREILMFGLFSLVGFLALFFEHTTIRIVAFGFGILLLVSIEMLYISVGTGVRSMLSSGNTIAIALVFASLFGGQMSLLIALLAFKTMIYLVKVGGSMSNITPAIAMVSFVRLILGFIIPFGLIALKSANFSWFLFLSIFFGELIDRIMFYKDFKPERPFDKSLADVK